MLNNWVLHDTIRLSAKSDQLPAQESAGYIQSAGGGFERAHRHRQGLRWSRSDAERPGQALGGVDAACGECFSV